VNLSRSKLRAFGVCLASLVVLTVILNVRSKTADLVLLAFLFGSRVALGILFLTRLRIHYDRDGEMHFRYDRPDRGILVKWHRWMLDEPSEEGTK
jgi:hypothetical protein